MSNDSASNSSGGITEIIITIIVIAVLFFVFRYIWHGITWAFGQYVELLRVK